VLTPSLSLQTHAHKVIEGDFGVSVGASVADIRLSGKLSVSV